MCIKQCKQVVATKLIFLSSWHSASLLAATGVVTLLPSSYRRRRRRQRYPAGVIASAHGMQGVEAGKGQAAHRFECRKGNGKKGADRS